MEKMKFETEDMSQKNIEKIGELFPNVITEAKDEDGVLKKAIDFDMLRQILSDEIVEGDEHYEFTWVGKKESILEASKPIRKTLRPCIEESKDWETTENLYIEGDNLEVLKLLQESYLGKIKMIYIDPPYNTGKDFIYRDRYAIDKDRYEEYVGIFDDSGNRLFLNTESNGRFHSDWCCMIYPRIMLARNLLSEDGVMFISIDDDEAENLKKMCNEIFGEKNFVAQLPTIMNLKGNNDEFGFAGTHEYTLCYVKNIDSLDDLNGLDITEEDVESYCFEDEFGKYKQGATLMRTGEAGSRAKRPRGYYPIYVSKNLCEINVTRQSPDDIEVFPRMKNGKEMSWRRSKENLMATRNEIIINEHGGSISFYKKQRLDSDVENGKKAKTLLYKPEYSSGNGTAQIKALFGERVFDNPKPLDLLMDLIKIGTNKNDIVLDFFSGSGTFGHAVMQLNARGRNHKYILIQVPEMLSEKIPMQKVAHDFLKEIGKPTNICEISKERLRRAGDEIAYEIRLYNRQQKINGSSKAVPDIGFRVLKLDDSNMKDVYYSADKFKQEYLDDLVSNIKEDRSDMDLIYGCLLEWGLPLSLSHKIEDIKGVRVHVVNNGDIVACFENNVPESVIKEIANLQPLRVVFRDSSFSSSPEKINVGEIFKLLAPNTSLKVI